MALWKRSKRTSSQSTHCGFQSWSSPECFQDKVYEKTSVTPEECLKAVKQHLWIDPHGDIHQVKEGHNVLSFIRTGALDYRSLDGTWTCRGGNRVNSQGHTEVSVLERIHLEFTLTSTSGVYDTCDRSVQVTGSLTLPEDRWSASGVALVDGDYSCETSPGFPHRCVTSDSSRAPSRS